MARVAKPKAVIGTDPQKGQVAPPATPDPDAPRGDGPQPGQSEPATNVDPDAAGGQGPQEVRHWIEVIDRLSHDGDHYAPGDAILLTSAQFDVLVKAGAVGGDWADGEAETEV